MWSKTKKHLESLICDSLKERTLEKIKVNIENEENIIKYFCKLRCEAEKIK